MNPINYLETENIAQKACLILFPEKIADYNFSISYTGRLKAYGGYASISGKNIKFTLSKKWLEISDEIQIGLLHELFLKLFKTKRYSMNVDLYNNFIKHLHIAIPKDKNDPYLEESFNRVNDRYFLGLVERPNLVWGQFSTRIFGSYDFKTDTIKMSTVFKETDLTYLDYIMFHEVLHKQRKFFKSGSKTFYHDKKFRQLEAVFENAEQIEKELSHVAAKARAKRFFDITPKPDRNIKPKPKKKEDFLTSFDLIYGLTPKYL